MREQQNVQVVQQAYEAFGRGDIDGVLGAVHDDVEWTTPGPSDIATAGTRRGKAQVREFFLALVSLFDIRRFEPKTFVADGDTVVVLGDETAAVRATGAVLETEWAHVFTFRDGRIARFQEYLDMSAAVAELRGTTAGTP